MSNMLPLQPFIDLIRAGLSKNLRWIYAIVLDFDGKHDLHDLAIHVADAGLPPASMMVSTPCGGIHV